MNKSVVLAAACSLAIAACGNSGQQASAGAPSPAPTSSVAATAAASKGAAASPGAAAVTDTLTGGRYLFGPFGNAPAVTIAATGPDGWVGYPSWAMDGPSPARADAPTGIAISFFLATGVYSDPCHWDVQGTSRSDVGDVPVGPTVNDLVVALRANTFYTSSVAKPVTIDGFAGQELELQLPDDPFTSCDKDNPADSGGHAFVFAGPGLYAQGPDNRWRLYILDVNGTRLITGILSYKGTPQVDLDTARDVIDTLDINP